jgi:2OG-Fe(II) oxygenase superfamily
VSEKVAPVVEIEKFVPSSYADVLEGIICRSPEFLWQYNVSTNNQNEPQIMRKNESSYESDQFVHAIFQESAKRSPFFDVVFPLFYFMEDKTGVVLNGVERMKANMLLKKPIDADTYNTPHIDIPERNFKSLLYYVTDSDGDTFIFNETYHNKKDLSIRRRVSPKKGKAVVFDSNIWHASSNPREHANRVVLNFIFSVK